VTANDSDVIVIDPNSMLSGVGSATGRQGVFMTIVRTPGARETTIFTVTQPDGTTQTWDAGQLGRFVPDTMYFQVMHAVE